MGIVNQIAAPLIRLRFAGHLLPFTGEGRAQSHKRQYLQRNPQQAVAVEIAGVFQNRAVDAAMRDEAAERLAVVRHRRRQQRGVQRVHDRVERARGNGVSVAGVDVDEEIDAQRGLARQRLALIVRLLAMLADEQRGALRFRHVGPEFQTPRHRDEFRLAIDRRREHDAFQQGDQRRHDRFTRDIHVSNPSLTASFKARAISSCMSSSAERMKLRSGRFM